jgi:hypothetical protein
LAAQPAKQDRAEELSARLAAAWDRAQLLMQASLRLTHDKERGRWAASQDPLEWSAYARLRARLASMPVIEQAKGIIMARSGCDDDEAFETLRRASQQLNRPVRELAAHVVAHSQLPADQASRPPADPAAPGTVRRQAGSASREHRGRAAGQAPTA